MRYNVRHHQPLLSYGATAVANPVWSTVASFTTARANCAAIGTTSSAAVVAGETNDLENAFTASVQIWNGSSWAAGTAITSARGSGGGAGTVTAALYFGGRTAATTPIASTIQGDATVSWSAGGNLSVVTRSINGSCGTQTAALHVGGYRDGFGAQQTVETYNGSTWTSSTIISPAVYGHVLMGSQTSAIVAGSNASTQATQNLNGVAWSAGANTVLGRNMPGGTGVSNTAALIMGGSNGGSSQTSSERFTAAWATTSTSLSAAKYGCQACGTSTSALGVGGYIAGGGSGVTAVTEKFS